MMIPKKTSSMSVTYIRRSIQKQWVREILNFIHRFLGFHGRTLIYGSSLFTSNNVLEALVL